MIFEWETQEERLKRFMRISAKEKLEWLRQMNVFLCKAFTKKQKRLYQKIREQR